MNKVKDIDNAALEFVVVHYQEGHLNIDVAWHSFKTQTGRYGRRDYRHVASVVLGVIFLSAAACGIYFNSRIPQSTGTSDVSCKADSVDERSVESVKIFRYDNCPINKVLKDVSDYYGVHLSTNDSTKNVSGEIEMVSSVDEVVDMLERTMKITIVRK